METNRLIPAHYWLYYYDSKGNEHFHPGPSRSFAWLLSLDAMERYAETVLANNNLGYRTYRILYGKKYTETSYATNTLKNTIRLRLW